MEANKKYCKHCGEIIDADCVICVKCGKQVEQLQGYNDAPIIINNSSSSSSSADTQVYTGTRRLPWYLKWSWIFILGILTGGSYWIVGPILRAIWNSKN